MRRGRDKAQCSEWETFSFNVDFFTPTFLKIKYFANKSMHAHYPREEVHWPLGTSKEQ